MCIKGYVIKYIDPEIGERLWNKHKEAWSSVEGTIYVIKTEAVEDCENLEQDNAQVVKVDSY